MTKLWQLLTFELGSAFKRQFGKAGELVFHRWADELQTFSEPELVRGLERFKNSGSTYMSLNVFRNHCKLDNQDLGIESFDVALLGVCRRDWENLHPAFQHIARKFDLFNLRLASSDKARNMFKPLYAEVVKRVADGEEFERVEAISSSANQKPELTDKDREAGRKALKALLG